MPTLPAKVVVLVNSDFESRLDELSRDGPRAYEADAAVLDMARAVETTLMRLGCSVVELRVESALDGVIERLERAGADVVFNLVESLGNDYGREWELPSLLGRHGLPYTGNGPVPLRLSRAKDGARRVLRRAGVRVPRGLTVREAGRLRASRLGPLPLPAFVKPARVDGSIGIDAGSLCADREALITRVNHLACHLPGPFLVEEYLPGKEINVSLFPAADDVETLAVAMTEIDFSPLAPELPRFVTYDGKWNPTSAEYASRSVPAQLAPALRDEVEALARRAFCALGGSGYGRVDMRLDSAGRPCVIDVNPNNDLSPEAGLALAAASVGVSYEQLIGSIVRHGYEVKRADWTHRSP